MDRPTDEEITESIDRSIASCEREAGHKADDATKHSYCRGFLRFIFKEHPEVFRQFDACHPKP